MEYSLENELHVEPSNGIVDEVRSAVVQGMSVDDALSIIEMVTQSLLSIEECAASLDITRTIFSKKVEEMIRHENTEYRAAVNEKAKQLEKTNLLGNRYIPIPRVEQENGTELDNKPKWLAEKKCRVRWYYYDPRRHSKVKTKIAKHISTTRTGKYTLTSFKRNSPESLALTAFNHENKLCEYRKLIDCTYDIRNVFKQLRKMENSGFAIEMEEMESFK